MAFTANNDLNVLQASDSAKVSAGAGHDIYVLSNGLLSENQKVQIIDSGANTIRLTSGLEIASSQVISNGFVLTLTNGAEITLLDSDGYTFEVGGDALTGQGATVQNFEEFVTQTLGLPQVPAANDVVTGGALTVGGEQKKVFTLTEIPTQREATLDIHDVDAGLMLAFLQDFTDLDLAGLGLLDENGNLVGVENINVTDNTATNSADTDGSASININLTNGGQLSAFAEDYLALIANIIGNLAENKTITQTGIVLTTSKNNGGAFEDGYTTSGDDLIIAGRTELLHGAYIDGGAGYNTLEVDMKGIFAQPFQLHNIQEVQVQNLANVYNVNQTILHDILVNGGANFPVSDLHSGTGDVSILDLSRARDLEKLVITEGFMAEGEATNLIISGIQNYATTRLEGNFAQDVDLFFGRGQTDLLTVELTNVSFGGDFSVNQNVGAVELVSEGRVNTLEKVDFGGNFVELIVSGTGMLSIEDDLQFGFGEASIDASANTGGVRLTVSSQTAFGNLEEITIVGSQGRDVFDINSPAQSGVLLNIDTGTGRDTVKISSPLFAGEGSVITGDNLTVEVANNADLREADVSGVGRFVIAATGGLLLTQAQVEELGAAVFVADYNTNPTLSIEVSEAGTVLSDLIDLNALDSDVKLAFNVKAGASLTLTAEELHTYLAEDGVAGEGTVNVTDAGLGFKVDDNTAIGEGFGSIEANFTGDLNVVRTADGYERPALAGDTDQLVIDTTDTGGVVVEANDVSDDDAFSTSAKTVVIEGSDDITFNVPVEMTSADFTLDFSGLTGALNNLTIRDFNKVGEVIGNGAEDLRINVEINGDVAVEGANTGLMSSGVEQYVVTNIYDTENDDSDNDTSTASFHVCDNTQDVEVLGLQGNQYATLTFTNVPWGAVNPTILFEGDGFGNWDQLPKAAGNPDASNVGTIVAEYFSAGAPANVLITNQGVAPGETSTGEARPIVVDGIETVNAKRLNITAEDGNTVISNVDGDTNLESITLTSDFDVTLNVDSDENNLDIDASAVAGEATLVVNGTTEVDFSDAELTDIDAVVMTNGSKLTLTIDQIEAIGAANFSVENEGDAATLNIGNYDGQLFDFSALALDGITVATVTFVEGEDITVDAGTDFTGVTSLIVPEGTNVVMSAAQFKQLVETGATITTGAATATLDAGSLTVDMDGDLTIGAADETAINGSNVTFDMADGEVLNVGDFTLADGLQVTGDAAAATKPLVNYTFDFVSEGVVNTTTIDVAAYQDVDLRILDSLLNQYVDQSIENLLENLASANILNIYQEEAAVVGRDPRDRVVVVEPNAEVNGIEFSAEGALADYVRSIELTLQANADDSATINGNISVNDADVEAGFTTLTINAEDVGGAAAPVVINGNIVANDVIDTAGDAGELTSVVINANTDITVNGTLVFNSLVDGSTATLTLNGAGDITISALDATDVDIDTLNIVNNATGVVNVPGASPATTLAAGGAGDVSNIVISGTGDTLNFGTADDAATVADESNSGVNADDLESINAAGYAGDLNLGIVTGTVVAGAALSITGSQGVTTLTLGQAADNNGIADVDNVFSMDATSDVTINLSGSAAGSAVTITSDAVLPNMLGEPAATAGSLTISGALVIEGNVDFRTLVDIDGNNKLDLSGVTGIELAAGASIQLTDDQWADLTPAQQAAIEGAGQTLVVDQAFIDALYDTTGYNSEVDLTELRGVAAIQIDEALTNAITMTDDQAAVATTGSFDIETGEFTAGTWDKFEGADADGETVAAGNFTNLNGTVKVIIDSNANLTGLVAVDTFDLAMAEDTFASLTLLDTQWAALTGGDNDLSAQAGTIDWADASDLDQLADATVQVKVQTGEDSVTADPEFQSFDVAVSIDRSSGTEVVTVSGNAGALAAADTSFNTFLDSVDSVEWTGVGSEITATTGLNPVTLVATNAEDTFTFLASPSATFAQDVVITNFAAGAAGDVLDFTAILGANATFANVAAMLDGNANNTGAAKILSFSVASLVDLDDVTIFAAFANDADAAFNNNVGSVDFGGNAEKIFLISQGVDTGIIHWKDAGNGQVDDGDTLTLIGVLDGVVHDDLADLSANNFILA